MKDGSTDLDARIRRLEDERAVERLVLTYGPAADARMPELAASLWLQDGLYDWAGDREPHEGSVEITAMLAGRAHQSLVEAGVAHFAGPPLISIDEDEAVAINYSIVMRNEGGRFYLWRVSAARWDLERTADGWRVRMRTNRLLDASGEGSQLFGRTLETAFTEPSR